MKKKNKVPLNTRVPVQTTISVVGSCFLYSSSLNQNTLPPGVYRTAVVREANFAPGFEPIEADNDRPLEIDSSVKNLLAEVKDFLGKRQMFQDMGFSHKRGYLMHGPPGCGKSSTLRLLEEEFIDTFSGVVLVWRPEDGSVSTYYDLIRKHEPDRAIMLVVEDIDSCLRQFEEDLLEFLDGQRGLQNFVLVATTNNLNVIPSRIKDRPSRIDRLVEIGKPTPEARAIYLENIGLNKVQVGQILAVTDNTTVAQLKEVVVGHLLLGGKLEEVVKRVTGLEMKAPEETDHDPYLDYEDDEDESAPVEPAAGATLQIRLHPVSS